MYICKQHCSALFFEKQTIYLKNLEYMAAAAGTVYALPATVPLLYFSLGD